MLLSHSLSQQQQQQQFKRRTTAVVPKRNWIQRNPRLFQVIFITTSLLTFFSKPLYDAFVAEPMPAESRLPAHRR